MIMLDIVLESHYYSGFLSPQYDVLEQVVVKWISQVDLDSC